MAEVTTLAIVSSDAPEPAVGGLSPLSAAAGDVDDLEDSMPDFEAAADPPSSAAVGDDLESGGAGDDERPKTAAEHRKESGEDRMKIRPASWLLQLLLWATFVAFLVFLGAGSSGGIGLAIAVLLVLLYFYVKMCLKSGTRQFVGNLNADMGVQAYMQKLETTAPIIRFTAICWHVETHYRTVTDSQGHKRTESYNVNVYTHSAAESYPFTEWEDGTLALSGTDSVSLTKLHLSKELGFLSDAGRHHMQAAYDTFCDENRKDDLQIFSNSFYVPEFKERILCVKEEGQVPWWVGSCAYWFASILLMNVPYRAFLDWNTGIVRHVIVKKIDATGEGPPIEVDEAFAEQAEKDAREAAEAEAAKKNKKKK
eukprot:g10226.t1